MSAYSKFFLKTKSRVAELELLEISHPNFTKTYRIVRNKPAGVTVTLDGGQTAFEYYPLRFESQGSRTDLDYGFTVTVGDLGTIIPAEMDALVAAAGFATKPTGRYMTYSSANLTAPLFGPVSLIIPSIQTSRQGATFEMRAPALNSNRTGENYLTSRFEMLQGLI